MPFFSADSFRPPPGKQVYFDTNIWLMLYGPDTPRDSAQERRADAYARLFCDIASRRMILTSHIVLSEFINRFARVAYYLHADAAGGVTFKKFRKSPHFRAAARDIRANVGKILKYATLTGEPAFEDSERFWAGFSSGVYDFNDHLIYTLCQRNNYILVTDDGDMNFPDIDIVTGNRKLLRQSL